MPEPFSELRLTQLEERWRRDPGSRIFLQLAEELRRGGRLDRAVEILRQGLGRHPGYLSAQVALGRCLLESGAARAAAEVLERAVAQDPAQLVASRLLIEAHLRNGEPARARSRLDLYRLFAERAEEIQALEARIEALEALIAPAPAPPPEPPPPPAAPAPARTFALGRATAPLLFDPAPRRTAAARDRQPFGPLPPPANRALKVVAALHLGGVFPVAPPPPSRRLRAVEAPPLEIVRAPVAAPPPPPPVVAAPPPAPPPVAAPPAATPPWRGAAPAAEVAREVVEPEVLAARFSPREIGAEVERETMEEPFDEVFAAVPVTPPVPAGEGAPTASVTLAELYLAQGHLDEAERAFRAVLALRPREEAAVRGLAEIARRRAALAAELAAEETASGWEAEPGEEAPTAGGRAPMGGLSRRKIDVLRTYLERLRRGARADVS